MAAVKHQKDQQDKKYGVRVKSNHPAFADMDALFKDLLIDIKSMRIFLPNPKLFFHKKKTDDHLENYYTGPFGYRNQ